MRLHLRGLIISVLSTPPPPSDYVTQYDLHLKLTYNSICKYFLTPHNSYFTSVTGAHFERLNNEYNQDYISVSEHLIFTNAGCRLCSDLHIEDTVECTTSNTMEFLLHPLPDLLTEANKNSVQFISTAPHTTSIPVYPSQHPPQPASTHEQQGISNILSFANLYLLHLSLHTPSKRSSLN